MSRPATGTVKWRLNPITRRPQWMVRLTLDDGGRSPWLELDGRIPEDDEAGARRAATTYSQAYRASGGLVKQAVKETVSEYATKWLASREGRVRSNADNASHLEHHVLPVIGTHELRAVGRDEIERFVAKLDEKIARGTLSAKSAKNIWGTCTRLFRDAAFAKPSTGLRRLQVDPTRDVQGPEDDQQDKLLQFLYPSEFSTFVACEDVPRAWRRNVAVAVYLCLRDGEQRALRWPSVDLVHGVVTIGETFDRRTGKAREGTKGGAARQVPIPAELLPLLQAMHDQAKGKGLVCDLPSLRDMARGLRRYLDRAGVTRRALHTGTSASKPCRWHDLRATGLTWMAVRGDSATSIRDVAGHTQTSMTDRYMRQAGVLRGGRFGEVFPALPDPSDLVLGGFVTVPTNVGILVAKSAELLRGGRDSNPRPPA